MNSNSFVRLTLLLAVLLAVAVTVSQARGGRRGGGSFGGFLGGWRKYKKPVNAGNSRRTTNGSPMHTTITKSSSSGSSSSGSSLKATKQAKEHASYPKQQMPAGAGPGLATGAGYQAGGYYGSAAAHLPAGGTYYANTASMPVGAVYYAQPPMRSSSGTDFLFGMMAGHALFGHRPHVTHVYQQSSQPAAGSGSTVLVINNGEGGDSTTAPAQMTSPPSWPAELDVPLAPFNATITTPAMLQTATVILPSSNNSSTTAPLPQAPVQPVEPVSPPAGIICVPMLFNETDPNDPDSTQHVEKIICFPAPPPPTPTPLFPVAADMRCITRTLTEPDPSDPTKTIEILEQDCAPAIMPAATTTSTVSPPVAGDIGDGDVVDVPLPE